MVRAKVDVIRLQQSGLSSADKGAILVDYRTYLAQAEGYTRSVEPAFNYWLMASLARVKVRRLWRCLVRFLRFRCGSDVERKRLAGGGKQISSSGSGLYQGVYHPQATEKYI